jgi:hypothetical protein
VPSAQGRVLQPLPLIETKVSPAGVGSASDTPCAVSGPLFFTMIV